MTGRARRAAIYAFVWHSLELALVIELTILLHDQQPLLLGTLLFVALVGWAWSLAHLPGQTLK